jgi:hypothetical protein
LLQALPPKWNNTPIKPIIKRKKPLRSCYDFGRQPNVWMADIYAGPSLVHKDMRSEPDDRPYLNQRLATEVRGWGFNAGARASFMLHRHLLFRTGVHYDYWVEKFTYIDPDYVKYLVEITIVNGTQIVDTVGVEYGENYTRTYNRFGLLDIPLIVGAELRHRRSGFNINAGVSFNVLFHKRGAILSPAGQPEYFSPQNGRYDLFQNRVGMSAVGSVQWFYHIRPKTRVFAEPYFRQVLRPVTLPTHPVIQQNGVGGIRFGFTQIID